MAGTTEQPGPVATALARYVAATPDRPLPEEVSRKAAAHVLDTLAAMVSGSALKVGRLALAFVAGQGGREEASVAGLPVRVPRIAAAFANGLCAHADETDDSHLRGRFHPGCGIVPAALASAEANGRSGEALLRAVVLGYDVGARSTMSLGFARPDTARHSSHSIGPLFGATAAAAALHGLDERGVRHAFSYAVQQASGVPYWQRDGEHVEKAFDFGGMGARNGVTAAALVAAGFTAVEDPFSGRHSFFTAFGEAPDPAVLVDGLGERHEIMATSIKKWCVGSPLQSVLDAVTALIAAHAPDPGRIEEIAVTLPDDRIHIVERGSMPAVSARHLVALALVDGGVTFASTHDEARMSDPAVAELAGRIRLVPSTELTAARPARQSIVEIVLDDDTRLVHRARSVRGTPDDPMDDAEVAAKALDLVGPVLGPARARALVEACGQLPAMLDAGALAALLRP